MAPPRKLLIAGCGKLGIALAHHLKTQGESASAQPWEIWGLRRHTDALPDIIHPWAADLGEPETLSPLPTDFSHVIYTATPPRYDEAHYLATYRDGLRHLLDALQAQSEPPSRIILVSSTSVYAQDDGDWIDEDSEAAATHFAGAAILEGEALLQQSGLPNTIIRFGGIYGPDRTQALLNRVRAQTISLTPDPRYTNRIHEDDCVGILAHLLDAPEVAPLYLGVDGQGAPRNEVLTWMAHQLGLPTPPMAAPAETRSSRRPFTNKRCKNQRLLDSGYQFRYEHYKKGYAPIIQAWRQQESLE